jgi:hypothetical protein
MIRLRILTALLFIPVLPIVGAAQGFQNAKYAGEFLGLGVGGRYAGLGGSGTGIANDVTAGYFNPASLSLIRYPQIAILHESRFSGQINYDYAAGAIPLSDDQTVALSAIRVGLDGIKDSRQALVDQNGNGVIDEDDRIDESKIKVGGAADWALFGSYSRKIDSTLSVGGSLKVLYRTVLDNSAWGLGIDVSAMYRPLENLMVGATLSDATKSLLSWDTGNQEFVVPSFRLGASYFYPLTEAHGVRPVIDGIFRFEGRHQTTMADLGFASLDLQGGLEYSYRDRVFVRGGYSEVGQLSVGAGIKLPKLNIDYAFTRPSAEQEDLFGPTHRISLMLTLEEERYSR